MDSTSALCLFTVGFVAFFSVCVLMRSAIAAPEEVLRDNPQQADAPDVEFTSPASNATFIVGRAISADGSISVASIKETAMATMSASNNIVTVDRAGVADAERFTITVNNVMERKNAGNVLIPFNVPVGETTGSGSVGASGIGETRAPSGETATGSNFRSDVTANGGTINASDIGLVKSKSGTQLP